MIGGIGIQEIVIILIVGLLVFGAARLPKIARSLGQGIKEFKKTVKGLDEDEEDEGKSRVKYVQQQPPQFQSQQYPQGQQYTQGPVQPPYATGPQGQGYGGGTPQQQWTQGPVPPYSGPVQDPGVSPEQSQQNPKPDTTQGGSEQKA